MDSVPNADQTEAPGPALLRGWLLRGAAEFPAKPCIVSVDQGKTISYGQMAALAARIGAELAARGLKPNDRVALLANNGIEHLAVYFGTLAYGATVCTVHVEMNRAYLDRLVPALKARLVLYEDGLGLESLAASLRAPCLPLGEWSAEGGRGFFAGLARRDPSGADAGARPGDDAVIFFTSGTSATPKGVILTYRELLANAAPIAAAFGLTEKDRLYDFRSFNWASAQMLSANGMLAAGATLILARKFSRSRFFHDIALHGATVATGNPTTLNMLLNGDDPMPEGGVPTLRFVTSSSAPLLVEEWKRFEERFGLKVAQGYGSSESGWIAGQPGEVRRFGTVGKPLPYLDLAVVDREGRRLPPGEIGHVEIGGHGEIAYRYLTDDGTERINGRGRLRTGDMGFLDAEGFLHLTGREKDLIIRGGVNISPLEIDGVLLQHDDVAEAAAIGVPDRIYGEEVVAYAVAKPGARVTEAALIAHCAERLAAFKAPKRIALAEALPKTERGKLDRKALAARWRAENA